MALRIGGKILGVFGGSWYFEFMICTDLNQLLDSLGNLKGSDFNIGIFGSLSRLLQISRKVDSDDIPSRTSYPKFFLP